MVKRWIAFLPAVLKTRKYLLIIKKIRNNFPLNLLKRFIKPKQIIQKPKLLFKVR